MAILAHPHCRKSLNDAFNLQSNLTCHLLPEHWYSESFFIHFCSLNLREPIIPYRSKEVKVKQLLEFYPQKYLQLIFLNFQNSAVCSLKLWPVLKCHLFKHHWASAHRMMPDVTSAKVTQRQTRKMWIFDKEGGKMHAVSIWMVNESIEMELNRTAVVGNERNCVHTIDLDECGMREAVSHWTRRHSLKVLEPLFQRLYYRIGIKSIAL